MSALCARAAANLVVLDDRLELKEVLVNGRSIVA